MVGKMLWHDYDQNGAWERRYYDAELDGYFEWVMGRRGLPGGGMARQLGAPRPFCDRRNGAAYGFDEAFNILVGGNVPIFGPVAWPVGG